MKLFCVLIVAAVCLVTFSEATGTSDVFNTKAVSQTAFKSLKRYISLVKEAVEKRLAAHGHRQRRQSSKCLQDYAELNGNKFTLCENVLQELETDVANLSSNATTQYCAYHCPTYMLSLLKKLEVDCDITPPSITLFGHDPEVVQIKVFKSPYFRCSLNVCLTNTKYSVLTKEVSSFQGCLLRKPPASLEYLNQSCAIGPNRTPCIVIWHDSTMMLSGNSTAAVTYSKCLQETYQNDQICNTDCKPAESWIVANMGCCYAAIVNYYRSIDETDVLLPENTWDLCNIKEPRKCPVRRTQLSPRKDE